MKRPSPPRRRAPPADRRRARRVSSAATAGVQIVGIGASAGGFEALEQFLSHVPAKSGLAFVIIPHLDPNQKALMAELLQRCTDMPVSQVRDGERPEPDRVYIIPPNKDMSILRGVLHLFEPVAPRGLRLPIDLFFRALAEDQRERSIGVVLSGMGTDGTLGVRAIKEAQGVVLVQDPSTARFDSMPRSALDSGVVDLVAAPDALCSRLIAFLTNQPTLRLAAPPVEERVLSGLEKVVLVLRQHTGHDFSQYKPSTLYRRIERRVGLHQLGGIADYVRLLRESPQERDLLFKELLIGVTGFFRDPAAWRKLEDEVLPALCAARPGGGELRAWVAGCSTGEEAYSLVIAFKEAVSKLAAPNSLSLRVFATDLDQDAVDRARGGLFPENIVADVPAERLTRYFVPDEGRGYRVRKDIREMVTFASQNLTVDPPFTKLDLLVCRNVLIYLGTEMQSKLLRLFHYSLNPDGCLFLGAAETVGQRSESFAVLDSKWRLYRRRSAPARNGTLDFSASAPPDAGRRPAEPEGARRASNIHALAEQLLLRSFTPAAVLVDRQGDILYVSGHTGKYLEPAAGRANWNLFAMTRDGLRHEMAAAFRKLLRKDPPITMTLAGLRVRSDGASHLVDVTIQPLVLGDSERGPFLVVFSDQPAVPGRRRTLPATSVDDSLRDDVRRLETELQTTREEMQSSHEELKSANEELQSTNEELQSTNEELTTAKEEMQSLNEELQTVNAELQAKVDELSRTNNDMKNLLNSTDIATLFLDEELHVRRFTTQASRLIKLIASDIGRPVTDIASDLLYPALAEDVGNVLLTLVFAERRVATTDGRLFSARVMPYRTLDNKIDGVVVTFTDVTAVKVLETQLKESRDNCERLTLEHVKAPERPERATVTGRSKTSRRR
jgi:two-component system, chemotaxis family, CheB/CheR fusion protein